VVLVIKSVQESDAGKYICQVRQIFAYLTTVVYTDKWFENRKNSGDLFMYKPSWTVYENENHNWFRWKPSPEKEGSLILYKGLIANFIQNCKVLKAQFCHYRTDFVVFLKCFCQLCLSTKYLDSRILHDLFYARLF
jgi:hypothetical protein